MKTFEQNVEIEPYQFNYILTVKFDEMLARQIF